jgi:hypothetical protein
VYWAPAASALAGSGRGRKGLIPPGTDPGFARRRRRLALVSGELVFLTTLCERRAAPAEQFFTESLILAQDERWRRA